MYHLVVLFDSVKDIYLFIIDKCSRNALMSRVKPRKSSTFNKYGTG